MQITEDGRSCNVIGQTYDPTGVEWHTKILHKPDPLFSNRCEVFSSCNEFTGSRKSIHAFYPKGESAFG